jgi:hypothetical protein
MKLARGSAIVALFTIAAVLIPLVGAAADEPQPAAAVPAAGAGLAAEAPAAVPAPAAGLADLPENQAEAAAVAAGELKLVRPEAPADANADAPALEAARAARRAAFDAVLAEQESRVQALVERLPAADGRAALALQQEIEQVKKETGRRLLEVQLELATRAGDENAVQNLQAALADWDAPQPARQPVDRPVPHNQGR